MVDESTSTTSTEPEEDSKGRAKLSAYRAFVLLHADNTLRRGDNVVERPCFSIYF